MAKFTDAWRVALQNYFNAGDQPTEAQFTQLMISIQQGIEEHDHSGTGDGDGVNNLVGPVGIGTAPTQWLDMESTGAATDCLVRTAIPTKGGWTFGSRQGLNGDWVLREDGIADRITVDRGTGYVGVGIAPAKRLEVYDDVVGYAAKFHNDGNNDNRNGIQVWAGLDANSAARHLSFQDGDGDTIGYVKGDGAGGTTYFSASDERLKNILGPIDPTRAMEALVKVDPIQYVGKGLTEETGQKRVGFSAQAMLKHFPEVVNHDEETDMYNISYERLVSVLWAQNQALLKRIEQLEEL